jgi:hypothetical protein
VSTQKDYRHCLDKLASAAPRRKAALIRSLLPGIESALNSGQSLTDIWEALGSEGLQMSYHGFHKEVWRARRMRKPTAASGWRKQDKPSEAQGLQEPKVETVEGRDPFVNLRRLEENRPGFHWRGTRNVNTSVHGKEDPNDKNKRYRKQCNINSHLAVGQGRGWKELDLRGPVEIFPEIAMCPLLSSDTPSSTQDRISLVRAMKVTPRFPNNTGLY